MRRLHWRRSVRPARTTSVEWRAFARGWMPWSSRRAWSRAVATPSLFGRRSMPIVLRVLLLVLLMRVILRVLLALLPLLARRRTLLLLATRG
jgi:hypothetical protein